MAGRIDQNRCATESELVTIDTPWYVNSGRYAGTRIRVRCHRALKSRLKFAFKLASKFSKFGGGTGRERVERIDSYNCRPIRGSETLSWHGKGAALDIFATPPEVPPPGGVWTPDNTYGKAFARCFTDLGFTWGANWTREDRPHIQWTPSIVPPLTWEERKLVKKNIKERYEEER